MKPNINSSEVHPQLSNNGHLMHGVLVAAGSLLPSKFTSFLKPLKRLSIEAKTFGLSIHSVCTF